jgi:hypothetical protein
MEKKRQKEIARVEWQQEKEAKRRSRILERKRAKLGSAAGAADSEPAPLIGSAGAAARSSREGRP